MAMFFPVFLVLHFTLSPSLIPAISSGETTKNLKPLHAAHIDALVQYCPQVGKTLEVRLLERGPEDGNSNVQPELPAASVECNKRLLHDASKEGFQDFHVNFMNTGGRSTGPSCRLTTYRSVIWEGRRQDTIELDEF
jgi:hypothetical protein